MRSVFFVMYGVMAVWMLVAAVLRVTLSVANGVPVDVLPAITGGLGLVALAAMVPRTIRRLRRRPRKVSGTWIEVPHDVPPPRE